MPSRERLVQLAGGLAGSRVVVLGDVILDRYLWGKVERLSPEAPVPVLEYVSEKVVLGGAANVANNVRSLGGEAVLMGVVGRDDYADVFRAEAGRAGIEAVLFEDETRPTIVKTRVIGGHQQIVRVDREKRHDIDGGLESAIAERLDDVLAGAQALVLSDYGKGVLTPGLLERVRKSAARYGIPVVVDPKDTHFSNYRGFSMVTPNLAEASLGAGFRIKDEDDLLAAGRTLLAALEAEALLITRGAEGMSLFLRDEEAAHGAAGAGAAGECMVHHIPARAREVYDVTGAGDTVVSVLAMSLAAGLNHLEAAHLANWAAGVVVAKMGTATLTADELIDYLERFA